MTEEDFKDNFMVIIGTFGAKNLDYQGVYIKDILADDKELTIILDKDNENGNRDVSVKLPIEMDRENIKILLYAKKPEMYGYKPVDEIMVDYKNYTVEQAIEDNCVIHTLYSDFDKFDKFLEETKQGKNGCIRIILYWGEGVGTITDIEYKDGEYIIEETFITEDKEIGKRYYKGDTFEVDSREIGKSEYSEITYSLIDTKREKALLERSKKTIKEDYEKEMEQFCEKSKRLESYKFMEKNKGNVFDESKIDEYDKLYLEEYKKGVEKYLEEEYKMIYESELEGRLEQKEEIFFRYELTEEYKSN